MTMARSLQLEVTEDYRKLAKHSLARADILRAAHTAQIPTLRLATRNKIMSYCTWD